MSCAPYYQCAPCVPQYQCVSISANVTITSTTSGYNTLGQVIPLVFTITNTGSTPISSPIILTSTNVAQIVFYGSTIQPLGTAIFNRYYRITAADLSQPSITFTAYSFTNIAGCPSHVPVTPLSIQRIP